MTPFFALLVRSNIINLYNVVTYTVISLNISDILGALSDDKSLVLFNMCAFNMSTDSDTIMTRLGIRRKQYYSRMNRLINAGLVMRKSGKYFLTSLGRVVYESHKLIGHFLHR